MKSNKPGLLASTLFAIAFPIHAMAALLPNGDFSNAGTSWEEVSDGGTFNFSYPATDGNPDGFGVIDNSANDGGFGIWVANDGVIMTLESLGLTAGNAYTFTQDMKILSGSNIGGVKIEYYNAAGAEIPPNTGNLYPALIGTGATWETYEFPAAIPSNATGIKVVPLWGPGSSVAFDNIGYQTTTVELPPVPNGDFENGSTSWLEIGGNTTWSYPTTGGNPDGFGQMANTGASVGLWVANGGAPLSLDSLGITAGEEVTFLQDMKLISGTQIGGLKIEFLRGAEFLGQTEDLYPTLIGNGSTWETYSFPVTINPNADHIKIVPLTGAGSTVGYDNVSFGTPPPSSNQSSATTISYGKLVEWNPTNPTSVYQPQLSFDNTNWTNLGPEIVGNTISSTFDPSNANFHRVLEQQFANEDAILNGSFELEGGTDCAESWTCFTASNQPPTRITTDFRTGTASMRIAVQNSAAGTPNQSELQYNVQAAGGTVTPGNTYDFSFWAKQISSGVSYVQNYRLQWLGSEGEILLESPGFTGFTGGNGSWTQISTNGIVAPAGAASAYIQIFGATGAVAGAEAKGEVLIDDASLITSSSGQGAPLPAIRENGIGITWQGQAGKFYQVQTSFDLVNFEDFGPPFPGGDLRSSVGEEINFLGRFYRVVELP
ncbi:MAG: hypothetical protein ACSHYF_14395 [Verrucomicrobiaceae bacterium]